MENKQNPFHTLPTGKDAPAEVNVIIEISRGSRTKYEYNKKFGMIEVDRILHTPIPYPFSYGLIPQTWNDYDHDPLDAIVISSEAIIPGALASCRVIGMMSVDDSGERDDKILAVISSDPYYKHVQNYEELPVKDREDMQYFMEHYKDLEKKKVVVKSWENAARAREFISECMECYKGKF